VSNAPNVITVLLAARVLPCAKAVLGQAANHDLGDTGAGLTQIRLQSGSLWYGLSTRSVSSGVAMKRLFVAVGVVAIGLLAWTPTSDAAPLLWQGSTSFTNVVASQPTRGGGYPVPPGSRVPLAGTCRPGPYNANHSESWLAVDPGSENLVGTSKIFFDKYSTFYMFHLGAMTMPGGTPSTTTHVQGYDCVSTGTQAMPPSWTDNTDPNVAFDTQHRAYQVTLPFNAFWDKTTLHPDGAIDLSYSDDLGRQWVKGNGGNDLEQSPNASAKQLGHVEDKQWVAVNAIPGNKYQDHVYAMWSVFNKDTTKIRIAVSRDRGQTFSKAVTMTAPSQTGPSNTFIYPSVDAVGDLYVAFASFPINRNREPLTLYVARSTDDGVSFSPFVAAVKGVGILRRLGRHEQADGREIHPVNRPREDLVRSKDRQRQQRFRQADRPVPAVGGRWAGRRGGHSVL
jgi:hypothetical protein